MARLYFVAVRPELQSPGKRWWDQRLRELIETVGREAVAENVFVAELFPYHSNSAFCAAVPSQRYTFHLVECALQRGALVIFFRSRRLWEASVPALVGYQRTVAVANAQRANVSRGNLRGGSFEVVVRAVAGAA